MVLTDVASDNRNYSQREPVAKKYALASHAETLSVQTLTSANFVCNGVLKQYKYIAPNLDTDTEFSFTIQDQDGAIIFSSGAIADNKSTPVVVRIAESSAPLMCSGSSEYYTAVLTWSTAQIITEDAFKILLYLTNH
jgi:hypothetical protein